MPTASGIKVSRGERSTKTKAGQPVESLQQTHGQSVKSGHNKEVKNGNKARRMGKN